MKEFIITKDNGGFWEVYEDNGTVMGGWSSGRIAFYFCSKSEIIRNLKQKAREKFGLKRAKFTVLDGTSPIEQKSIVQLVAEYQKLIAQN